MSKPNPKKETERHKERTRTLPLTEAIVTRHKSALQKRQLRNKEASIKKITEMTNMLKSPTNQKSVPKSPSKMQKEKESPKGDAKSPPQKGKTSAVKNNVGVIKKQISLLKEKKLKSPKKTKQRDFAAPLPEDTIKEFVPKKQKRNIVIKKISLKPRHELKLIGSKRKMAVPHRGLSSSPKRSKLGRDSPSMQQLILAAEETLSDEDLMEILTCPSPVWWEEPPEEYFYKLTPPPSPDEEEDPENVYVIPETSASEDVTEILKEAQLKIEENKNKDENFMKKRSVLENLLGNIRSKTNSNLNYDNDRGDKGTSGMKKETKNTIMDTKMYGVINKRSTNKISLDRVSESTEDDELSSLRDDIFLEELENIQIPIETKRVDIIDLEDSGSPDEIKEDCCMKEKGTIYIEIYKNDGGDYNVQDDVKNGQGRSKEKNLEDKLHADENNHDNIKSLSKCDDVRKANVNSGSVTVNSRENIDVENGQNHELKTNIEIEGTVVIRRSIRKRKIKFMSNESERNKKNQKIKEVIDRKGKYKTQSKNSEGKMKKYSPKKKKIISFEPDGLPVENLDTELLNEKAENKRKLKETMNVTERPKTSGIKIQKSKPDIMTVYKIICQDKFPLEKDELNKIKEELTKSNNGISEEKRSKLSEIEESDICNRSVDGVKNRMDLFYKTYKNRRIKSLDLGQSSKEAQKSSDNENQKSSDNEIQKRSGNEIKKNSDNEIQKSSNNEIQKSSDSEIQSCSENVER